MKKAELRSRYLVVCRANDLLQKAVAEQQSRVARAAMRERAVAWFRHQLNQAIETTEQGHTVPPGSIHETAERMAHLEERRRTYRQVLDMLSAPIPPHFDPGTVNVYAERFVTSGED